MADEMTALGTHTLWGRMVPPSSDLRGDAIMISAVWVHLPGAIQDGIWVVVADADRTVVRTTMEDRLSDYVGYMDGQTIHLRVRGGAVVGFTGTDVGRPAEEATVADWRVMDGPSLVRRLAAIPGVGDGVFICRRVVADATTGDD